MSAFNDLQQNTLLIGCLHIHERMAEMEAKILHADERTPFSKYVADLSPVERRVLRDYMKRIREAMFDILQAHDIPIEVRPVSLRWSLQTALVFLEVAVDEMGPSKLRGYGTLTEEGRTAAERIQQQLDGIIEKAAQYLQSKLGGKLAERLPRLKGAAADLSKPLQDLDEVLTRQGLVEFRPQFDVLVERLENPQFEIAVFGRVSSGKSSLLNHVAGRDVLPVGVTPITAVPTRLTWGERPEARIEFAISNPRQITVEEVSEYASEEENPGNVRHVTKIEVRLPSPRLRAGVVFVDTPGVGSLARAGAAETFAYLPRCDLGVVLVDSSSALNNEDLELLRLLQEAGTPAQVLLSKADLVSPADRERTIRYIERQTSQQLGESLPVFAVSTLGEHERLLTEWFDREIAPRTDQHRAFLYESLSRKLLRLAESAQAVLRLRRDRQPLGGSGAKLNEVQTLLTAADDTLREGDSFVTRWSDDTTAVKEAILDAAARHIVREPETSPLAVFSDVVVERLASRGQAARQHLQQVQAQLISTVELLADKVQPLRVEPSAVRDVALSGLPVPVWTTLGTDRAPPSCPWWASVAPSLAVNSVFRRTSKALGKALDDAVRNYDHQLRTWMRDRLTHLKAAYDSQVDTLRHQLRRGSGQFGGDVDPEEVERDLHRLERVMGGEHFARNGDEGNSAPSAPTDQLLAAAGKLG
jgi:GTP-binding protein EngB required for normal cell division